ncbi:MAG: hypothetical protein Q8Q85_02580 [Gemmatimonadales bacterium]|nr:hypothetical protein [Gemmatimonadales bacterium]
MPPVNAAREAPDPSRWTRRGVLVLLAAVAAPPAAAQCPDGSPPPCRGAAARVAAAPAGSIAVLPFVNRSPDSADAYLADALPEQIFGRLARVRSLAVKSPTAVAAQWRRTPDPMAAARALRVEWFVTGSIRRAARQLSVSAELVRAASGDGAWGAPFRRGDDDLAAIEEQIAESVAVGIVGRLAPAELTALRRTPSRNTDAYRLYLYGRSLAGRRTTADIQAAVNAFAEAVGRDSAFASAWARLAFVRSLQVQWGNEEGLSRDSLVALSGTGIDRALRLDSNLSEAWHARGTRAAIESDLGEAHHALERALRLDSLSADTFHALGYLYSVDNLDLPDVAESHYRRALALDPDLRNSWRHLALSRRDQGRLAESEAMLDTALARGPWGMGHAERASVRFARGNGTGALADLAEAQRLGNLPLGTRASLAASRALYAVAVGDSAPARARLDTLRARADSGRPNYREIATVSAALGQREAALSALESLRRSATPQTEPRCGAAPCSVSLATWRALHDPILAPLQSDPRFQRLLAETRPRVPWLAAR